VVVGSGHPRARLQSDGLGPGGIHEISEVDDAERAGERAAAVLRQGATAVLRMPASIAPGAAPALLEAMARAAAACVTASRPGAIALVGGETAHAVLRALAQPYIRVTRALEPLIVGGELVGGALAGMPVVTKGGSAGEPGALVHAVEWLAGARP
jgi:hypothetical protein